MKILISTAGSHGDVLPFIGLGREFLERGHEVVLYANPYFQKHVLDAGLAFVPISTIDEYESLFGQLSERDPRKAFERVAKHFAAICGDYYTAMKADVEPRRTITIGSSLMFAPRLLREIDGIPCATVHLAPSVFRSNERPARLVPNWIHDRSPTLLKHLAWWTLDKVFYDPHFTKPLNMLRTKLGLLPVEHIFRSWLHEADCVVGLFPDWFADRPSDWPANAMLTDFPLYDHGVLAPLPDSLRAFIDAGPRPVAFSAGTATSKANDFFAQSVEACRIAGLRGILLSHFPNQVPAPLPDNIIHVPYAPFSSLLPKLAAFVHHGGIGSTSHALRAGVPQLIRPVAYDQFDNAARAVRLGVARELLPKDYQPAKVAAALRALIDDMSLHATCAGVAEKLTSGGGLARTSELILRHLAPEHIPLGVTASIG